MTELYEYIKRLMNSFCPNDPWSDDTIDKIVGDIIHIFNKMEDD